MDWCIKIIIGFIILLHTIHELVGENKRKIICYDASQCVHSFNQKCGINKKGVYKRFQDSCSMKKHNCEHNEEFIVTLMENCKHITPFTKKMLQPWERTDGTVRPPKRIMSTVRMTKSRMYDKTYWCKKADNCRQDKCDKELCGHDRRIRRFQVFPCECNMADVNCFYSMNFTRTNHSIVKCQKLIDESSHIGGHHVAITSKKNKLAHKRQVKPKIIRFGFNIDVDYIGQTPKPEHQQETISTTESVGATCGYPNSDTEHSSCGSEEEELQSKSESLQESGFNLEKYYLQKLENQTQPPSISISNLTTEVQSEFEEAQQEPKYKPAQTKEQQSQSPPESNTPKYDNIASASKESLSEPEQQPDKESKQQSIILSEEEEDNEPTQILKNQTESRPQTEQSEFEDSQQEPILDLQFKPAKKPKPQTEPPSELNIPTEPENIQSESKESLLLPDLQSDVESNQKSKIQAEEEQKLSEKAEQQNEPPSKSNVQAEQSEYEGFLQEPEHTPAQKQKSRSQLSPELKKSTEPEKIATRSNETLSELEQQSDIESNQKLKIQAEEEQKPAEKSEQQNEPPSKSNEQAEESESEGFPKEPEHIRAQKQEPKPEPPPESKKPTEPETIPELPTEPNIPTESNETLSELEQQSDIESKQQSIILSEEDHKPPEQITELPSKLNKTTQPQNMLLGSKEFEQQSDVEYKPAQNLDKQTKILSETYLVTATDQIQSKESLPESKLKPEKLLQPVTKSTLELFRLLVPQIEQLISKGQQSKSEPETKILEQSKLEPKSVMEFFKQLESPKQTDPESQELLSETDTQLEPKDRHAKPQWILETIRQPNPLKLEPESEPETLLNLEFVRQSDTIIEQQSDMELKQQSDTELKQQSDTELKQQSDTELKQQSDTELKQQSDTELKQQSDTELKQQSDTELKQQSDTELKQQSDTELKQQSDPELKQQSDIELEEQSDIDIDGQSVPQLDTVITDLRSQRELPVHEYYYE